MNTIAHTTQEIIDNRHAQKYMVYVGKSSMETS